MNPIKGVQAGSSVRRAVEGGFKTEFAKEIAVGLLVEVGARHVIAKLLQHVLR